MAYDIDIIKEEIETVFNKPLYNFFFDTSVIQGMHQVPEFYLKKFKLNNTIIIIPYGFDYESFSNISVLSHRTLDDICTYIYSQKKLGKYQL